MSCECFSGASSTSRRSSTSSGTNKTGYCLSLIILFSCVASVALLSILLTLYIYFVEREPTTSSLVVVRSGEVCGRHESSPLLLTPYIQTGQIGEAQNLAQVETLKGVRSYSGFLTINETFNGNIFFWFFPARTTETLNLNASELEEVPLILYLQGGPGLSSLFGLFLENGPLELDKEEELQRRENSWANTNHLLYLDSPIGTGFSFADSSEPYATGQNDVAKDLYIALVQFFRLFPSFQKCNFFIAGTSYSGKTIPTIGYKIHTRNNGEAPPEVKINLKGLLIGSGYFDGNIQDEYSDFYYHLGLLDAKERDNYRVVERRMKNHLENKEFSKAREELTKLVLGKFMNYTGFDDIYMYNALQPHTPPSVQQFENFLNTSCMRSLLHVGDQYFNLLSVAVYSKFSESDFYFSPKTELERLLNSNYKILFYSAQFDLIVTHVGQSDFIQTLTWHGTTNFHEVPRRQWKVNNTIAGYVKEYDNLTYFLIRNAGHTACFDQPLWCEAMVTSFTKMKD